MRSSKNKKAWSCFAVAALLSLPVVAGAESEPEDIIKYRQNVMKANGANMGAIAAILQGKVPEYKDRLGDHARGVQAGTKNIPALFPDGSDFGDTEALESVWKDRAGFKKRSDDTSKKADALAKAVAGGDAKAIQARFRELSDSCKACHKDFRKEQQ
ncbi:c-type cytochrome [Sulfurifustis variabilis]|nr:cytochrome c [Sulfurifustis variabilis]